MTSCRRLLILLLGLLGTAVVVRSQGDMSTNRSVLQSGLGRRYRGRLLRRPAIIRIRRLKKQRLKEPESSAALEETPVINFKCPRPDGLFADLSQCDKYFECRNDVVTEYRCPGGPLCRTERLSPCGHPVGNACGSSLTQRNPQPKAPRIEKLQLEDPQPEGPQHKEEGRQAEETKPAAPRLEKLPLNYPQHENPQQEEEGQQPEGRKPETPALEKLQVKDPQPEGPHGGEREDPQPEGTKTEAPRLEKLPLEDSEPEGPHGEEEDPQPEESKPEHRRSFGGLCEKRFSAFNRPGDPDCGAYTRCLNHIAYPSRCPEGLAFDPSRLVCVYADEVETCDSTAYLGYRCAQRRFSADDVDHFTLEPHPTNCTKFFVCVNKEDGFVAARPQTCLDGTIFDTSSNGCKNPSKVSVARCGGPSDAKTLRPTRRVTDPAGGPTARLAINRPAQSPPTPEQLREIEKKRRREARLAELRFKLQSWGEPRRSRDTT